MTRTKPLSLLLAFAAIALVALVVAGCGGGGGDQATAASPSSSAAGASSTIGASNIGGLGKVLVDSNATWFGGTGFGGVRSVWAAEGEPHQGQPASAFITLPPLGVLWLGANSPDR